MIPISPAWCQASHLLPQPVAHTLPVRAMEVSAKGSSWRNMKKYVGHHHHHHHHHHHTSTSRSMFSNLELTQDHVLQARML